MESVRWPWVYSGATGLMHATSCLFVAIDLGSAMGVDCGMLSCLDEAQLHFLEQRGCPRGHCRCKISMLLRVQKFSYCKCDMNFGIK